MVGTGQPLDLDQLDPIGTNWVQLGPNGFYWGCLAGLRARAAGLATGRGAEVSPATTGTALVGAAGPRLDSAQVSGINCNLGLLIMLDGNRGSSAQIGRYMICCEL
ncbi:unnamed protein product [Cuscuta campestris]|uniref:Uncharacterized protein n=1 Tax=Cuscuta campestris TaxID=132261 RepID=A0A484KN33_9ASTE|nr:unnamed protein product [Cuscuta campestris]